MVLNLQELHFVIYKRENKMISLGLFEDELS